MKIKKLAAGLTSVLLFCACGIFSVVAESDVDDFLMHIKQPRADIFEVVLEAEAIIENQVGSITSQKLEGLAVICSDVDSVREQGIGTVAIDWSDGSWSSASIPSNSCRMQPISGFAECYGKTGEYVSGSEYITYTISQEFDRIDNTVYLLTMPLELTYDEIIGAYWAADYSQLLPEVIQDERFTLLGAVYGTQTRATIYTGASFVVKIKDDIEEIPEELMKYGSVRPYYSGYYLVEPNDTDYINYSDAMDLCAEIMQIDSVAFAYPGGTTPEVISKSTIGFGIELLPYNSTDSADDDNSNTTTTGTTVLVSGTTTTTNLAESVLDGHGTTSNAGQDESEQTETTVTQSKTTESAAASTVTPTTSVTDSTLPQTGNNSIASILIMLGAFLLIGAGAWTVYRSGITHRKENEV